MSANIIASIIDYGFTLAIALFFFYRYRSKNRRLINSKYPEKTQKVMKYASLAMLVGALLPIVARILQHIFDS